MRTLEEIEADLEQLGGTKPPTGDPRPKKVPSQTALAEALGVHRETIRLWMKKPGNPGRTTDRQYDVAAWDDWAADKAKDQQPPEKKSEWEINRLKIQCERLRFDMEVTKGKYSLNSDVERWVSDVVTNMKSMLLQIPSKLAPQVVALEDPAEAEAMIRKEIDDALSKLHEGTWQPDESN
jgi:hypothetical protein